MSNMSGGGPQTPPGYYKDAQGSMRWWDGSGWTERLQETEALTSDVYGQAPVTNDAKEPWYKKKRYQIPGAIVALLVIVGSMGDSTEPEDPATVASDTSASEPQASQPSASKDVSDDAASAPVASESSTPKPKPKPKPVAAAPAFDMEVGAGQMLKDYESNEAAADLKYDGKSLKVTGVVEKVDTEFWDDEQYIVEMHGGGDFVVWTVNCNDMTAGDVQTMQKGQTVTILGEFDDGGDLGVELKDCKRV